MELKVGAEMWQAERVSASISPPAADPCMPILASFVGVLPIVLLPGPVWGSVDESHNALSTDDSLGVVLVQGPEGRLEPLYSPVSRRENTGIHTEIRRVLGRFGLPLDTMDFLLRMSEHDGYPSELASPNPPDIDGPAEHHMASVLGHFKDLNPYCTHRGLDFRRVPLLWKGESLPVKGHHNIARIFMGISRVLSNAVYGESEGGIIQFDRAVGTPFRLVAVRLSRIVLQGERVGAIRGLGRNDCPAMVLEPATCSLITEAKRALERSGHTLRQCSRDVDKYTPFVSLIRHHILGAWAQDYLKDTANPP